MKTAEKVTTTIKEARKVLKRQERMERLEQKHFAPRHKANIARAKAKP